MNVLRVNKYIGSYECGLMKHSKFFLKYQSHNLTLNIVGKPVILTLVEHIFHGNYNNPLHQLR